MGTSISHNKSLLPNGWALTRLGDVVTFEYGKGLVEKKRDSKGKVPVFGSNGIVGYHSAALVEEPCLIVGRKGTAGRVHLSKEPCWPIDTTYYVISPAGIDVSFLFYLMTNLNLHSLDKSTAVPGLNRNDAYSMTIPLPPLNEQVRMTTKIEELFTKLDAGMKSLETVKAQLKRFRQSVLKLAFDGKLTEKWRRTHRGELEPASKLLEHIKEERTSTTGKHKEHPPVDTSNFPELPEGWTWAGLDEICPIFVDSAHRTPKYVAKGLPAFRPRDVVNGRLDLENVGRVSLEDYEKQTKRREPKAGDIVYSRELSYGWAVVVPENTRLCLSQGMVLFRPSQLMSTRYVVSCLNGPIGRSQAEAAASGTAHPHINLDRIKSYLLPIPSIQEQYHIVTQVDRLTNVADDMARVIAVNLKRAETLRHAILISAFEGKLVPQDPSDEPASVLLERINSLKAQMIQDQEYEKGKAKRI